ncbi:hypothetical protein KEM54_000106 [Ascosphaera aggregata]|nr:hypothetical protein KEM54_000106 [Ascosphaera aggregata]
MSGKRLLDLITLYDAAKGVAGRHIALQCHWLDVHLKTSSLTKGLKDQAEHLCSGVQAARALSRRLDESYRTGPVELQRNNRVEHDDEKTSSHVAADVKSSSEGGSFTDEVLRRDESQAGSDHSNPAEYDLGQVFQSPRLRRRFTRPPHSRPEAEQTQRPPASANQLSESSPAATFKPAPWANYRPGGAPIPASSMEKLPSNPQSPSSVPFHAPKIAVGHPTASPETPVRHMIESRVPSSRLGRLWEYSGLATSVTFGVIGEGLRRATGNTNSGSLLFSRANVERLVAKLSRMRGAALKIGQMMSFQDMKMMPETVREVLQRVQDQANYMPASQRDKVLTSNLGPEWRELFDDFEDKPLAAASIGQVHGAVLKSNGQKVAVKVQYPGVADSIDSDLNNISILLTASKLLPKGLYLDKTIDNARRELAWECDYVREAKCAQRFKDLLKDDAVFHVPEVIAAVSGKQVLTMERVYGIPVTRIKNFTQAQRDWIGTQIMRLCFRELCEFRFMQTDPNWTNFLYNESTGKIELLDFGASREYSAEFISQYLKVILAAARNDRAECVRISKILGYLTGLESQEMVDAHIKSLLTLAEPYMETAPEVYDFSDQTITDRIRGLIPVMLNQRLTPPPEETYSIHRKLSGAFLLCARLGSKVRCKVIFNDALRKVEWADAADGVKS